MTRPTGGSRAARDDIPTPARPVEADWLALRRPADAAAREGTQRLITRWWRYLHSRPDARPAQPVHVIDVGAGTGANQDWLGPRLPFPARWTLLDHDAELLDQHLGTGSATRVHGGLADLPGLLDSGAWATVVVASALLDLLTYDELDVLASLLVERRVPALFSLTVDGDVTLVPSDPDDAIVDAAFDAHQRRDGIAGASAAGHLTTRLRESGAEVVEAATPWRLTSGQRPLVARYLTDRAAVAVEQDPSLEGRAQGWLDRRRRQREDGSLAVVVGHVDLLILPR